MREHAGFLAILGAAPMVAGGVFIPIGLVQAERQTHGLQLWSNAWFVVGIAAVALGLLMEIAAAVFYFWPKSPPVTGEPAAQDLPRVPPRSFSTTPGTVLEQSPGLHADLLEQMKPPGDALERFLHRDAEEAQRHALRDALQEQLRRGLELSKRLPAVLGPPSLYNEGIADESDVEEWEREVTRLLTPLKAAEFMSDGPTPIGISPLSAAYRITARGRMERRLRNLEEIINALEGG